MNYLVRSIFLLTSFIFIAIVMSGLGSSQSTCNGSNNYINSTTISDGCSLITAGTYNFATDTYYLNGSLTGAINTTTANIIINGNGSTLIGNFTSGIGLNILGRNVTINNLTVMNYRTNIYFGLNAHNFFIDKVTSINSSRSGIHIRKNVNGTIQNSLVYRYTNESNNFGGILLEQASNTNIRFNNIINYSKSILLSDDPVTFVGSDNNIIQYNNITFSLNDKSIDSQGIYLQRGSDFNLIEYNNILNSGHNGISILTAYNNISHNYIYNAYHHGVDIFNCDTSLTNYSFGNLISNNTIYLRNDQIGSAFLYVCNSTNNLLQNNYGNYLDSVGFLGILSAENSKNNIYSNNILVNSTKAFIEIYNSTNETFINNSYYIDSPPRQYNLITDLSYNFTFSDNNALKYSSVYFKGLYNSSSDNLWYYFKSSYFIDSVININSIMQNYLIYFSNNSVACSNINSCDGNINITLTPNNFSYVLDNFNITEGVTRQFSPVTVSGSSTSKTITSSLTQSITATVIVNADNCADLKSGSYQGSSVSPSSCSSGQAIFLLTDIPTGESTLTLVYGTIGLNSFCSNTTSGIPNFFSSIAVVFSILAVVIILGFLFLVVSVTKGDNQIDWNEVDAIKNTLDMKVVFVAILGIVLLGWLMITILGVLCQI